MHDRVTAMIDQSRLNDLCRLGRLLDEAIDLADAAGETLLGAQIAQTLHLLDARVTAVQVDPFGCDHRATDRGDGAKGG